jgi:hypothetical protein
VTFNPPVRSSGGSSAATAFDATIGIADSALNSPQTATLSGTGTVPAPQPIVLTVSEVLHVSDSIAEAPSTLLNIAEMIHTADALTSITLSTLLNLSENIHVSDSPALVLPIVLNIAEAIHTTDAITSLTPSTLLNVAENIVVTDAIGLSASRLLNVAEAIHVADSLPSLVGSVSLFVNEVLHVADGSVADAGQLSPLITWASPKAITYGTKLTATQLNASATQGGSTIPGVFTYSPAAGSVLGAGSQTISVTFRPTNTSLYATVTTTRTVAVMPAILTVTAKNASMTYGASLPSFTYAVTGFVNSDALASAVAGSPAVSTAATSQSPTGTYTITTATGNLTAANYNFSLKNGTLTINKATLIAAATNISIVYGNAIPPLNYTLTGFVNGDTQAAAATGSPALSTTGNMTSPVGKYPITITAGTLAAANYSFTLRNGVLTVNIATPTIAWANPAAIVYGMALGMAQQDATSPVAGTFVYSPVAGTVLAAGAHTLSTTFKPTDTTDYKTVNVTVGLTVSEASQTISFTPPSSPVTYGVSPITLSAASSAKLAVAFRTVLGPARVSGSTLTVTGAGTVVVAADQVGNSNYQPAPEVTETIVVNQATPSIALKSSASSIALGKSLTFTATLTGNSIRPTGTVTFFDGTSVTGTGTLNVTGVATYTTSTLTVGPHSITAIYGGDINYVTAVSGSVTVVVP